MKRDEYTWNGFVIPAEGQLCDPDWIEPAPCKLSWWKRLLLWADGFDHMASAVEAAEEVQAVAYITDLLRAARDELVECRLLGDARQHDGTDAVHSDGEPPIAYVIDRIERMIRRDR